MARSSRPRRPRSTCTRTRRAPTASCSPGALVAAAFAVGVRTFALTDHDTLAGYRDVVAGRRGPGRDDPDPGRRDQRPRDPRPRAVGGRAAHPRVRHGSGRRGVRGRDGGPARPAPAALRADRRPTARDRDADRCPGRRARAGRRRRPRPPDDRPRAHGGGLRRRASRTRSTGSSGTARRATSVATAWARRMRSARSWPPVASRCWPTSARRRIGSSCCASSSRSASPASRSTTARSMSRRPPRSGRSRPSWASSPTGGTDYHGDLGPYAESHAALWVPPEVGERLSSGSARRDGRERPRGLTPSASGRSGAGLGLVLHERRAQLDRRAARRRRARRFSASTKTLKPIAA